MRVCRSKKGFQYTGRQPAQTYQSVRWASLAGSQDVVMKMVLVCDKSVVRQNGNLDASCQQPDNRRIGNQQTN